jgi:hypothetical protein
VQVTRRPAGLLVADPFRACLFPCSDIEFPAATSSGIPWKNFALELLNFLSCCSRIGSNNASLFRAQNCPSTL